MDFNRTKIAEEFITFEVFLMNQQTDQIELLSQCGVLLKLLKRKQDRLTKAKAHN